MTSLFTTEMSTPTVTEMNRNFVIRWRHYDEPNASYDRLIGAGKYAEKFGENYRDKHFTKAVESGLDKVEFGIRGKYHITFFSK